MTPRPLPPPLEAVVALQPFRLRRQVRWSECDPAGVVYAGQFVGYMLAAVQQFRNHISGPQQGRSYGTPGKGLEIEYLSSLWPDQFFDMTVWVGAVGTRTTHLLVEATDSATGTPVFMGRVSSICIPADDRSRSIPVPDALRSALLSYQRDCGPLPSRLERVSR